MTGITPARSSAYGNMEKLRTHLPDGVTLTQYFLDHGYIAKGGGKVHHGRGAYDEASWDQHFSASSAKRPKTPRPKNAPDDMWVNWGPTPLEDSDMFDAQIALACNTVATLEQHDGPTPSNASTPTGARAVTVACCDGAFARRTRAGVIREDCKQDLNDSMISFGRTIC